MEFNSGDAMSIAYQSVTTTTGSSSPVDPEATLDQYNMRNEDIPSVKSRILNNQEFGLPSFQRTMNPNALNGLDTGETLGDLADLIFEQSAPAL